MDNYLIDETELEDEMALCELEDESLLYDWEDEFTFEQYQKVKRMQDYRSKE